ncbi:MAG: hypothetical protein PF481_06650 [Bacteroidales bacterium]|jgi:lipopolysaccharide export system protein LptA|nr:hypothetical protein [Bacteroidales bacterium]
MKHLLIILFSCISFAFSTQAQTHQIKIVNAEKMKGNKQLRKLYGSVVLSHKDITMKCDSAYLYAQENIFKAYNNITIKDNSVTITADSLDYNSNTNMAQLRGNVVFTDKDMKLTTQYLDYNTQEKIGYYYNNGTLTNDENTLLSERGIYFSQSQDVFFKKNVELLNKDYNIFTDTLQYNTNSKISYFLGPTHITSSGDLLYTENGWYDTETNISEFFEGSYLQSGSQFIYGDHLTYDRNTNIGIARKNVRVQDTSEQIEIRGEYAYQNGNTKNMYITDSVLLIKEFNNDSLFLNADSILYSRHTLADSSEYFTIKTYYKVRFYSHDIQGVCDSLVYNSRDSAITLFSEPILWSEQHQITGTAIILHLKDNELTDIQINSDSFIVSEDSQNQYNQMKGVALRGYIQDNKLHKITISKSGETLYYIKDKTELIGINKAVSDSITILIVDGKAQQIIFKSKPNGILYPPGEIAQEETILPGFSWHKTIRPRNRYDIYIWKDFSAYKQSSSAQK